MFLPKQLPRNLDLIDNEIYHRLHSALSYKDISARMEGPALDLNQQMAMDNERFHEARQLCHARCWTRTYSNQPRKGFVEYVEILTSKQIKRNTTWDLSSQGIKNPLTGQYLPLDYFLEDGYEHTPSQEIIAALTESRRLRALAAHHGVNHWCDLSKSFLPRKWFMCGKYTAGYDATARGSELTQTSDRNHGVPDNLAGGNNYYQAPNLDLTLTRGLNGGKSVTVSRLHCVILE